MLSRNGASPTRLDVEKLAAAAFEATAHNRIGAEVALSLLWPPMEVPEVRLLVGVATSALAVGVLVWGEPEK